MKNGKKYSKALRLAALLLALLLMFAAVACGGSDKDGASAPKPVPSLSREEAAEIVTFEDAAFEAAFRGKYEKTGDITRGELWEMT